MYPLVHHEQRGGHDVYYFDQRALVAARKWRKTLDLSAIADDIIRSGERCLVPFDDPEINGLIRVHRGGTIWSAETGRSSYTEAAVAIWLGDIHAVAVFAQRIWKWTPWTQVIAALIDDWASPYLDDRYGYARQQEARRAILDYARAHIQAAREEGVEFKPRKSIS